MRAREDEIEDLERSLAIKKVELQKRRERFEREEKEKEKEKAEREKIRKNKLQRAKKADERGSERESTEGEKRNAEVIDIRSPPRSRATAPPQERDADRTARWVAESANQEQARRSEEERMSEMARAAVAAVHASDTGRDDRRQQTASSRLEALKVVERKRPEVKFET